MRPRANPTSCQTTQFSRAAPPARPGWFEEPRRHSNLSGDTAFPRGRQRANVRGDKRRIFPPRDLSLEPFDLAFLLGNLRTKGAEALLLHDISVHGRNERHEREKRNRQQHERAPREPRDRSQGLARTRTYRGCRARRCGVPDLRAATTRASGGRGGGGCGSTPPRRRGAPRRSRRGAPSVL